MIHAIVLAGGSGDRFGAEIPKQFVRLAGEEILSRSLRAVVAAGVDRVVVVAHADWLDATRSVVAHALPTLDATVVAGGRTRNESTLAGLAALEAGDDDVVVIHDAVRPLVPVEVVARAIAPVAAGDTLVIVEGGAIVEIPDRARYRRGQTPQVFRAGTLRQAYATASAVGDLTATDDCSLVLRYVPGARVLAVAGDEVNLKITTRVDLVLADRMLQMRTIAATAETGPTAPLTGARIHVIGGTNGIGAAIVGEAERLGASVVADGRRTGLDVRDAPAVEAAVGTAAARLGGIDHVIVTAGLLRVGPFASTDAATIDEVVGVNLTGALNVARAAYPHLRATRGSLTLFASSSFTRGRPDYVAYSASKAALVNAAQGLAEEWGPDGIRVNAVSPERTDTPMRREAFPDESRDGMLTAEEVAVATLRLVASDLTGQVFDVKRHDGVAAATSEAAASAVGRR
jgi:2-C-methyl-D-erythritol 4-phosphate cytidylyltransferase